MHFHHGKTTANDAFLLEESQELKLNPDASPPTPAANALRSLHRGQPTPPGPTRASTQPPLYARAPLKRQTASRSVPALPPLCSPPRSESHPTSINTRSTASRQRRPAPRPLCPPSNDARRDADSHARPPSRTPPSPSRRAAPLPSKLNALTYTTRALPLAPRC
ncbi:hypothetical protein FB451DRAFT_1265146 [Mycena latifolia]|nr:hypothetical protein FB451DRAFT_1265146 [Mycena latifolia]